MVTEVSKEVTVGEAASPSLPTWTVSVGPNPSPAERFAAAVLTAELAAASGEAAPAEAPEEGRVIVGTEAARAAGVSGLAPLLAGLGDDGFLITTNSSLQIPAGSVVLAASDGSERGPSRCSGATRDG